MGIGLTGPARYRDALDFLYARTTGAWKLGLERVEAFLARLGDPHRALRTIHVAGTNGKGSVCAGLEAVLRAQGLRVGKYTSPHLVDFRERFLVDGAAVEPEKIVAFVERWTPTVESLGATFFEATTAMAFEFFREAQVDVAVIETGLGGRLDATNVLVPLVATVTNIGIDHVEYLGTTLELIAAEKAGIFKRGVPAVIGEPADGIAGLLAAHAEQAGASRVRRVFPASAPTAVTVRADGTRFTMDGEEWMTPLVGVHQAANAAAALATLAELPADLRGDRATVAAGLAKTVLPGRFHRAGKRLFDVAHNPAGAEVLAAAMVAVRPPGPVVAVLSVLGDKDWRGVMDALAGVVDEFILTVAPTSPPTRVWDLPAVEAHARAKGYAALVVRDFDRALARGDERGATVLITGSFHTVGDAMDRLEVSPTSR